MEPAPSPRAAARPRGWILDPRYSLRARASLSAAAGALLFTLLLTWIATGLLRRSIESQMGAHFETLAAQVGDKLDRTIFERYRTLQLLANLPAMRRFDTTPAERRRALEAAQQAAPDFAWIGFADAAGRIIAATNGRQENTAADQRPWFRSAREQPYLSSLREDAALAQETAQAASRVSSVDAELSAKFLDLAVPVSSADGPFGGVLAAHVRWSWAREVQISVIPEIAARELVGVTVYSNSGDILLDSGGSGWTAPPPAPALPDRRARGVLVENALGGTTYLTAFSRSRGHREFRGLGWVTVVRQPVERVFAPVTELKQTLVRWSIIFTLIATIIAWFSASFFSRQLRRIGLSAERIREGDVLAVLPRPNNGSELAHMCGSLGDLVEDLRARQETLNAENARLAAQARERESAKS